MKKIKGDFAVRMADSVMARDKILPVKWSYDYGVVFKGWLRLIQCFALWVNETPQHYLKSKPDMSVKKYLLVLE